MGAGGIIQQKAAALLVAVTTACMYGVLSDSDKAAVDSIDAKGPATRTQADVDALYVILGRAKGC
jgi:hypothetical protein